MALSHGPPIVTNGLVLCLDAADRNSYPGSGATWTDLSGRGNTGTLTNGPTYSSTNGGSIVFDGVDDYISTGLNVGTTNFGSAGFTFNLALNVTNDGATDVRRMILGNSSYTVDGWSLGFNHDLSNDNRYTFNFYPSNNAVNLGFTPNFGNIEFITLLYDGSSVVQLYRNGTLLNSISLGGGTRTYRNDALLVGYFNQGGWNTFLGNIYLVQGYRRALTAAEIQQNFNALRGRFNI